VLLGGAACHVVASLGYLVLTGVPLLARRAAETTAFATLGTAGSLALAVSPPLGLGLLENAGPPALFLTASTLGTVAAGMLDGTRAALTIPPMLAELSRRSNEAPRGTSLAFFSVASALGLIVGASGGGCP
jgi:hypothetical protein